MKAKFKLGQKVKVAPNDTKPFTGVVTMVMKYERPNFFGSKPIVGYDYAVKADDDLEQYKCKEVMLTAI